MGAPGKPLFTVFLEPEDKDQGVTAVWELWEGLEAFRSSRGPLSPWPCGSAGHHPPRLVSAYELVALSKGTWREVSPLWLRPFRLRAAPCLGTSAAVPQPHVSTPLGGSCLSLHSYSSRCSQRRPDLPPEIFLQLLASERVWQQLSSSHRVVMFSCRSP